MNVLETQVLSEKEERAINEEICRLLRFKSNHQELREELLKSALSFVSAKAPCTIFRLNRTLYVSAEQEKAEKNFEFFHLNLPSSSLESKGITEDFERHIKMVSSIIETEVYRQFNYPQTGVTSLRGLYDLMKLLNTRCLRKIALAAIKTVEIKDVMFGWIRCNLNEVWIIGLRRSPTEPNFNSHNYTLFKIFLSRFFDFRSAWSDQLANQFHELLTRRQQEAIYYFICGLRDKETAHQMQISKRTLDTHWQHIFNKLGVFDKIMALDKLGMIRKAIHVQAK